MNDKHIRILAIVATIAAICMYTSYIFQIQENLAGHKASPIQPLCAAINCTLWVVYGLFKMPRDLPVAIATRRHRPRHHHLHHQFLSRHKACARLKKTRENRTPSDVSIGPH